MSIMDINYAMETTGKYIKVQLVQTSRSLKLWNYYMIASLRRYLFMYTTYLCTNSYLYVILSIKDKGWRGKGH